MTTTLASLLADIPSIVTAVMDIVAQVITLVTDNPLLFAFVGCAFIGIAIKYGARLLHAAKRMA